VLQLAFDGGYDSTQLSLDLAEVPVVVPVRLHSNRYFCADPTPRPLAETAGRVATEQNLNAPTRPPGCSRMPL
jgi:hypothetical protein